MPVYTREGVETAAALPVYTLLDTVVGRTVPVGMISEVELEFASANDGF
ncbi:predicted protein [Botrytis cinerea T4]|uniref:Uncharacterized protein n=1 Tax=Botryotinia fuckeliana (strain T4) TaxID=999810 RepID=G2YFK5_BOTF4|nr:predicted protein [Botrytis cinerea T4]